MDVIKQGILFGWEKNRDYGERLIADLDEERMVFQPAPGLNHPAWVFSHLNIYLPVIEHLMRGEDFADPKDHKFGMQSRPQSDRSLYASREELLKQFDEGHRNIAAQLEGLEPAVLDQTVTLPRWQGTMKKVAVALNYLMVLHESLHFGQLSAWRRVQGLPPV